MNLTFESFAKSYDRWVTKQDGSVLADIELFVVADLEDRKVDLSKVLELVRAKLPEATEGRLLDLLSGFNKYSGKVCAIDKGDLFFIAGGASGASPGGGGGGGGIGRCLGPCKRWL